jgi:hypothetical protein
MCRVKKKPVTALKETFIGADIGKNYKLCGSIDDAVKILIQIKGRNPFLYMFFNF